MASVPGLPGIETWVMHDDKLILPPGRLAPEDELKAHASARIALL